MPNTLFIGKVYLRFDELPSTNDYAAELLAAGHDLYTKSKPAEGTVIRADRQSAGRGQFGSRWESEAGKNLTFSVILYPTWLEVGAQFYLSMAVALGVHDALIEICQNRPAVRIKWPNDLYLGSRKTGGILIQNTLTGNGIQSSIVGIGLNINQLQFGADLPNAVSLAAATGREHDPEKVLYLVLECLERRYLQLKAGQTTALHTAYESLLERLGTEADFVETATGMAFKGTILGVTAAGLLRVMIGSEERTFGIKEIRFL
ncbi:MAG: biotin--[acetyl-CoA-carboxylase] ligase [Saprospiraceae bacterium]|nr:biotin--[acetyl-CoA-carboxylase] ligase [Saprospiraceae bacterium]